MTERPASIVRRQLQQAGYEDVDDLQDQEDIQFLMKFVYKSNVIGPVVSLLHASPIIVHDQLMYDCRMTTFVSTTMSLSI